jgi:diadenosine tetraphosphate (Ap4A) HIT family hydrolase
MDYPLIMDEVAYVHDALKAYCKPTKMNVGALGNMVPQLHIHIIARNEGDDCWPKPVWGHANAKPYTAKHLEKAIASYTAMLGDMLEPALNS